jgi:hypothetical protein
MRLLAILFIAIPLVFIAVGAWQAVEQKRKMTSYVVADGRVAEPRAEVRVRTTSGKSRSTTYSPVVRYRYEVGGNVYRSERVFPLSATTSMRAANELIAQYPVGRAVKVYHDPADPGKAFLVRRWEFAPYLFMMVPMIHLAVGVGLWSAAVGRRGNAPAAATTGGWHELPIRRSIAKKRRPWMVMAVCWYAVGLAACGHYFWFAEKPYGNDALIATPIYFAVGLIPLVVAVRYWILGRNAADARVFVDKRELSPGDWFNARTEQAFYRHLLIESADLGLVLKRAEKVTSGGKTRVNTVKVWEDWADGLVSSEQASPGRPLTMKHRFTIPPDRPGSSAARERGYPRHEWQMVVRVKIAGAPDYEGEFVLAVRVSAPSPAGES